MEDANRIAARLREGIEVSLATTKLDVVVMGPAPSEGTPAARLRQHIVKAAAEYGAVVRPEHWALTAAAEAALGAGHHLTAYEMHLVSTCDLVILIPDSPGSLCELGLFSAYPEASGKMIILANVAYPSEGTYVSDGPLRSAVQHSAELHFLEYDDVPKALRVVAARMERERANRSMANLLAGKAT